MRVKGVMQMKLIHRLGAVALLAMSAVGAQAAIVYSNITAKIVFNTGETDTIIPTVDGAGNIKIDFTPNLLPWKVGNGALPRSSATITILYTAKSDTLVNQVDLIFAGTAHNYGVIDYGEFIEDSGSTFLGSVEGKLLGGSLAGGSNALQNVHESIVFSQAVYEYKVKKTFELSLVNTPFVESYASIGFIEQNANPVPEPATMGALAVGAMGLLARRRRKA